MQPRRLIFVMAALFALAVNGIAGSQKNTIQRLSSIFENSTPVFQYTFVSNIGDQRGYTFGFVGFTSGTYSGTMFLEEYRSLNPRNALVQFLPAFKKIDAGPHDSAGRNPSTEGLDAFPDAFRTCGNDPDFSRAQRRLADRLSWSPARKIANQIGARYPITQGELYDAYVNHGEDGIRQLLRTTERRCRGTPRKGGVLEKKWLATFLMVRLAVLRADSTWVNAVDRISVYQKLLNDRNFRLRLPMEVDCYGNHFRLE